MSRVQPSRPAFLFLFLVISGLCACQGAIPAPAGGPSDGPDGGSADGSAVRRFEFTRACMGTEFRIALYAAREELARGAAEAALDRVQEIDARLSDYDPGSELSALGVASDVAAPTEPIRVSADLWEVLVRARAWARASGGAFDPTVGPYVRLWRRAERQQELPDEARLQRAALAVGYERLEFRPESQSVVLHAAETRLDLGGIAKGYAVDAALAVLREHGIESALVDGGGDIAVAAAPPGRDGWRVELATLLPEEEPETMLLVDRAIATSGDLYRSVAIDGTRYSHVLDARSGLPVSERRLVTVVANSCVDADACASALSVLGRDGLPSVERLDASLEARLVSLVDGRAEVWTTPEWRRAVSSVPSRPSVFQTTPTPIREP